MGHGSRLSLSEGAEGSGADGVRLTGATFAYKHSAGMPRME